MKEKDIEQYIAEARLFDQDRMLASRRITRVSLAIAGIAVTVALLSSLAVITLTPSKLSSPMSSALTIQQALSKLSKL